MSSKPLITGVWVRWSIPVEASYLPTKMPVIRAPCHGCEAGCIESQAIHKRSAETSLV